MKAQYFLLFVMMILIEGCVTPIRGTQITGEVDKYGCTIPPASVLKKTGIDFKLAATNFGKVAIGDFSIKSDPDIVRLTSEAVSDETVRSYLRCLAINRDKYTPAQQAYVETMAGFLTTKPTADQFLQWQNKNPFPSVQSDANGVSVNFPIEASLSTVIKTLAKTEGFAVEFKGCTEGTLKTKIASGPMTAGGIKELINKLPLSAVDKGQSIKYTVNKLEKEGKYEIMCN